jgi:peptidoglycan/LPS O-acetylase OafA/YrhL
MRAIAIIMVLVSHASYIFPESNNVLSGLLQLVGFQGVEIFFVLSGFLIGSILLKIINSTNFSISDITYFWVRRWFRTLPLYFLILLVNIGVGYYIGYVMPDDLWVYFIFLQNFSSEHLFFFPESWSLSIEEYAYILAPIALFIGSIFIKNKQRMFLWSTVFLILIFTLTKLIYYKHHIDVPTSLEFWNLNLKALVIYRLDAIYYGFILAYIFYYKRSFFKEFRYKLFLLGIVLLAVLNLILPIGLVFKTHPFYLNVLYLPLNTITITLFLPFLYYIRKPHIKLQNIVLKISVYSYAMYLLHYTFILYLMQLIYPFEHLNLYQKMICVLVYISITYILSSMVYKYYEKPITNLRDKRFFKRLVKSD